jgi:hypothetical protein
MCFQLTRAKVAAATLGSDSAGVISLIDRSVAFWNRGMLWGFIVRASLVGERVHFPEPALTVPKGAIRRAKND